MSLVSSTTFTKYTCFLIYNKIISTYVFIGSSGSLLNQLRNQYGIAAHPVSNAFYVADTYNDRILYFVVGNENGTVIAGGNGYGLNSNQLSIPVDLQFDTPSNSIIIANCDGRNVVRWTLGASNWTLIADNSTGIGGCPRGVIMDPMGNIYIADTSNTRVQFYPVGATNGTTIAGTTSVFGTNATLFASPISVVLDSQLNLIVADYNNHRIQKFIRY